MKAAVAFCLMVAALGFAADQVQADVAYDYPGSLVANGGKGPYAIGNVFIVNTPIEVNELGIFQNAASSFNGSVSVGIYAVSIASHELLNASLVVEPATFSALNPGTPLAGTSTRLQAVPGVVLNPGTYMVVANNYGNSGALPYYDNQGATPNQIQGNAAGGALSFEGSFRAVSLSLPPALSNLPDWGFFDTVVPRMGAGNFGFTVVPEAGFFGGIFAVLLAVGYICRCAWLKRKALDPTFQPSRGEPGA